jgi:hypothetical protein
MKKNTERRRPSRKTAPASALALASGSPLLRWADYDPSYKGNNRLSVYATKEDQRGNRPDLPAIHVAVVPLTDEGLTQMLRKLSRAFARQKRWKVAQPVHTALVALKTLGLLKSI